MSTSCPKCYKAVVVEDVVIRTAHAVRKVQTCPGTVSPRTVAGEVEGWDSVSHVGLILAVEDEFGIVFDIDRIGELRDIGDLIAECERTLAARPAA
ncbi:acyl carrier protein [Leptolyngbya sp. 15MV]|nr:acyl carrier protein [Leptolyngbya sp. 15MV]